MAKCSTGGSLVRSNSNLPLDLGIGCLLDVFGKVRVHALITSQCAACLRRLEQFLLNPGTASRAVRLGGFPITLLENMLARWASFGVSMILQIRLADAEFPG